MFLRNGVDKRSSYCGTDWQIVEAPSDLRFKQVAVGNGQVWAVSTNNELYFRENITKFVPDGTNWLFVSSKICNVSVNARNQVVAVTGVEALEPGLALVLQSPAPITGRNVKDLVWLKLISVISSEMLGIPLRFLKKRLIKIIK